MVFRREQDDDDTSADNGVQPDADFAQLLEESFGKTKKRVNVGDKVRCEILSVGRDAIIVSTGTPNDGFVAREDFTDSDGKITVKAGDKVDLYVSRTRGTEIFLSNKAGERGLADDLQDAHARGLPLEGKVEEPINGGFRVTIMGKRAFCPISQMDLKHIENPAEYIGKKFEFKITQFSERGNNIVISRRRLLEEQKGVAQTAFISDKKAGDTVTGTISRLEKYGAFIELSPGLEGLAHISELSWSRVNDPKDVVEVGQHVTAKILKIETEAQGRMKISLSLKQVQEQPWINLPTEIEEGRVVTGKVTRCLKFGAFVEISPGIEGLIPLSEMSYTKRVDKSDELVKEGEKIQVKIKEIDAFAKRISLSLRDAEGGDPWATVATQFPVGTFVNGTIERREPYGLFIKLADGVVGLLPKSRALESSEFGYDRLKPGDKARVRVAEVRINERRLSLDIPNEMGAEDWQTYVTERAAKLETPSSSLGLLGSQLQAAFGKKPKA